MKVRIFGLASGLTALVATGLALSAPAQASHEHGPVAHLMSMHANPDGTVTKVWKVGGIRIKAVGPAGSRLVGIDPVVKTPKAQASVDTGDTPSTDGTGAYATGASVSFGDAVDDPNEPDVSIADSQAAAANDGDPATTAPADPSLYGSTTTTASAPKSWCVYIDASGNDVHAKTCALRRTDFANNGNQWYNDSVTGSAWTNDGAHGDPSCFDCDNLTGYAAYLKIPTGGDIPAWKPTDTITVGSCQDHSFTVSSAKTGVSYTSTDTICPDSYGPYAIGALSTGGKWRHDNSAGHIGNYQYRHVLVNDMFHSPRGVGTTTTLTSKVWWD